MEQLVNFIIRPPRAEYNPKNDLLDDEFMLKGKWYKRKDLEVVNSRGDVLQCSHYISIDYSDCKPLPCVIYCHGNSGCRADASEAAIILLPSNITVFCLDFSGSGISGGEHVTLGWNEKDDLRSVVDYLRADGNVSLIGLWGRSMGAVTSLMYGAEDPSIAGMVLDSPFSDLVDLMMELVDVYKIRLPKFTVKFAIQYMRRAILKKAKFDISELNTIKVAKSCFVPVLFGHAIDDDFIQPHHSDRIHSAYVGDKNIIKFEGDHNSPRPQFYFDSICIFFNNVLQPPVNNVGAFFDVSNDYFGKGRWSTIDEVRCSDELSSAAHGAPGVNSTEDAIKQLRSRRPMSKMEVPSDISSKDEPSKAQEGCSGHNDQIPSSSEMISIELANGDPYGHYVPPASFDDEDYIEYSLDKLADFPSNAEEEERMLMEAVLESLKDLEVTQLCSADPSSDAENILPELYHKAVEENSSTTEKSEGMGPTTTSAGNQHELIPSEDGYATVETGTTAVPCLKEKGNGSVSRVSDISNTKETATCSVSPVSNTSIPKETGTNETSRLSDTSQNNITDSDLADHTKATVTVVKNPTGNGLDGFFRRWDLNFFRNR